MDWFGLIANGLFCFLWFVLLITLLFGRTSFDTERWYGDKVIVGFAFIVSFLSYLGDFVDKLNA